MPPIPTEDLNTKPHGEGPKFTSLVDATYEMAKKILPFLARRQIPLTPDNYRIFYDYFLGLKPELSKRVDELLESDCRFNPEISEEIFRSFYQPDEFQVVSIAKVSDQIALISESLTHNLGTTIDNTSHYREILSETVNQMTAVRLEDNSLKNLVDNLLEETNTALSSQNDLASHIEKTRNLIMSLTTELKDQTRLANIDELTQLYNRRFLAQKINQLIPGGENQTALSVLMFDLDRFKKINDTWGHNIGDKVLMLCAKIIKNNAGSNYLPVRFGGEEFLVICPGLEKAGAVILAENIRYQVESTQVTIRGKTIPVTISGGVAQFTVGDAWEELIARADKALYEAKQSGRNRIIEL
ncbi:MAG: GGDEF domain-containing protein [Deltaproteobacteria bacterium]|jgi:diguanylate cyclase|nr:GGDEF domain-containing protein [Deltaproteobacteria bacterium]